MVMADDLTPQSDLASREPTVEDLRNLCRELNLRGAHYVVIGGFAIRAAGYIRGTMDIDLVVSADRENETRVFGALATLPDNAVRELQPGELEQYTVIRVTDEIVVDLMVRASGINFSEAIKDAITRDVDGVKIPFASPQLLWRMKRNTHREKDAADLMFLRQWFAERGQTPPST
jgi:nucleotidyltransferase DUF2204